MAIITIRKIEAIGKTYRHLNRYRQILGVLLRFGFYDLKSLPYFRWHKKKNANKLPENIKNTSRSYRVRIALEELGPTFIKLGQILSTRPDLIPLDYAEALSELQDNVFPVPYSKICKIIQAELGDSPENLFRHFDQKPIGSASIAQVHKALLFGGEEVVVKIQRPNIKQMIEVDLEIMLYLIPLIANQLEELKIQNPKRILRQFARGLEKEMNFFIEGSHLERFSHCFKDDPTVHVPQVYHRFSSERIITLEYIDGIKVSDIPALKEKKYDLKKIANRGASLIMRQIFEFGFFHGDPHPGNVFILPNEVISYLDFGMMGRITEKERDAVLNLLSDVVRRRDSRVVSSILKLTFYDKDPDKGELERDISELIDQHFYRPLNEMHITRIVQDLMVIFTRYQLSLKPNLFIMMKALGSMESLGRKLNGEFNLIGHSKSFLKTLYMKKVRPDKLFFSLYDFCLSFHELLFTIPYDLQSLLEKANKGNLKLHLEHEGLPSILNTHEIIVNRLVFAIILSALIIGSSLIIHSDLPPKWQGIPVIGLFGFLVAGIMGFSLLIMMIHHRKM